MRPLPYLPDQGAMRELPGRSPSLRPGTPPSRMTNSFFSSQVTPSSETTPRTP